MLSSILSEMPCWYVGLAVVASLYYGARGVLGQRIAAQLLNEELKAQKKRIWTAWEIVLVRYVQDFIFHFVCSVAGFLSLFIVVATLQCLQSIIELQAGASVILVFCFLLGLVGVCGQLPYLLLEGRFPK
jgi:hypothetical protein